LSNLIDCPTPIASAPISSTRQAKPRQPLSHLYDSPCQVRSSRATPTRLSAPCLVETCLIQPNRQASSVLVISRLTNTTSRIYTRLDLSTQHDCPLLVVTYHTSTTYQSNTTSLIRSCLITSDQHDYPAFIASYPIRTTTHFSSSRVKSTRQSKSRHTPSLLINTTSHIRPRQFTSHQHDYPYRPNPYLVRPTRHASSTPILSARPTSDQHDRPSQPAPHPTNPTSHDCTRPINTTYLTTPVHIPPTRLSMSSPISSHQHDQEDNTS
jgi:hypothetical protein